MNRLAILPIGLAGLLLGACSHYGSGYHAKYDTSRRAAVQAAPLNVTASNNIDGDTREYIRGDGCGGQHADASGPLVGNISGGTRYACAQSPTRAATTNTTSSQRTYTSTPARTYSQPTYSTGTTTRTYNQPSYSSGHTTTGATTRSHTTTPSATTTRTYSNPAGSGTTSRSTTYSYSTDPALSGARIHTPTTTTPTYRPQSPEALQTDPYTIRQTAPKAAQQGYTYVPTPDPQPSGN